MFSMWRWGGIEESRARRKTSANGGATVRSLETMTGRENIDRAGASKELKEKRSEMFQFRRGRTQPHLLALRNVEYEIKTSLPFRGLQGKLGHN